jgi:cytochrome c
MDSWEFNKIAAAVLSALLIAFGGSTLLETMRSGHGGDHATPGYTLPVTIAEGGQPAATPAAPAGLDVASVFTALQTAEASAGESAFKKCQTCHTVNEGGRNGVGPNLWNIVNKEKGSVEGYSYSKAVREKEGKWDYESLANFIHDPRGWLRGNKMAFAGIKDTTELASILAYLRTLSANPAPLPAVPAAAPAEATPPADAPAPAPAETSPTPPATAPGDASAEQPKAN